MRKIATMENGNFLIETSPEEWQRIQHEGDFSYLPAIPLDDKARDFLRSAEQRARAMVRAIVRSANDRAIYKFDVGTVIYPEQISMDVLQEIANGEWIIRGFGVAYADKLKELLRFP